MKQPAQGFSGRASEIGAVFSLAILKSAAARRKPGYLDAVAAAGTAVTRSGTGEITGYYLTRAQINSIREEYAAEPAASPVQRRKTDRISEAMRQMEDPSAPCPFPGCEDIRASFLQQMKDLADGCTPCDRNAVRAKFAEIVTARLTEADSENT